MKSKIAATAAVLAAALVVAAPAAAKPKQVAYAGTTTGGAQISFKLAKGKMKGLRSSMFVSCSTGPSSSVKGGVETFEPGVPVKVGPEFKGTAKQYTPLAYQDVTKNYTIQAGRSGKRITGSLSLSFSYFIPDLYYPRTYFCWGTADFTAKAKK